MNRKPSSKICMIHSENKGICFASEAKNRVKIPSSTDLTKKEYIQLKHEYHVPELKMGLFDCHFVTPTFKV